VATGTIGGLISTAAQIDPSSITITPSSTVVLNKVTSYTVSIKIANPIPIGGSITIYFPLDIVLNVAEVPNNCERGINTVSTSSTACSITTFATYYSISFSSPFSTQGANINDTVYLKLGNVAINPISTRPVSPFSIYTYSSDASLIAILENALSVKMLTASTFPSNQISRISNKNG
jgi:hypothetical protein